MNDRWERLIDLYHSAVMLPADERATLLAEECGDDPALQADVERMIVAHHRVSRPTGTAPAITATAAPPADPDVPAEDQVDEPAIEEDAVPTGITTTPVEGQPIEVYADSQRLTITERLELVLLVCSAMKSAQRRGVAYGELSLASIMISPAGTPRLPDAGLGDDPSTPNADINAIGLILDKLLGIGVSVAGARRPLRRELDTIVLKAIRQEGDFRYESLDALTEDIQRYLDSPPTRERRDAKRPARPAKTKLRVRPLATWLVGSAAVIALGVVAWPRLQQRSPVPASPTPEVNAPAPTRTRLLVDDLADRASDPQLAAALSDALRASLTESPSIILAGGRGQAPSAQLTGTIAAASNGGFDITVQLSKLRNTDTPNPLHETATDSAGIIPALSRISVRVREQLGEPSTSIDENPRLEDVTSASLPALRAFSNASRAIRGGDRAGGIRWLKAAVAADTGYASAYRLLGLTYRDVAEGTRSRDALDHAVANSARLPFFDRNYTIASTAMSTGAGFASAIDAYNRILARDPRDARVLNSLGMVHAARREYAVQESLLVRALAVEGDMPWLQTGLAMSAVNQGKYDEARRMLDKTELRFGVLRSTQLARIAVATSEQDWDMAEREARETVVRASSDSVDALEGISTLGAILMAQGHLSEAEQQLRRAITLGARLGAVRQSYAAALSLAYLELRYRHSASAAVTTMNATLSRFPLAKMDPDDRPYDEVARLLADAGQPARAADLMADAAKARGPRSSDANRRWTAGAIAMAERRAWEGQIEIQGAAETHPCPICALPDLARAYEVAGKPDSAIATYERYLHAPWQRRFETDDVELGFAMKRLGELYQQQNEREKAAAQYTALIQLWRTADAELEPTVADVRRRLEQTDRGVKGSGGSPARRD